MQPTEDRVENPHTPNENPNGLNGIHTHVSRVHLNSSDSVPLSNSEQTSSGRSSALQDSSVPNLIPINAMIPHSADLVSHFPLTAPICFSYGPWVCTYEGPTFCTPHTLGNQRTVHLQAWQPTCEVPAPMGMYPYTESEDNTTAPSSEQSETPANQTS